MAFGSAFEAAGDAREKAAAKTWPSEGGQRGPTRGPAPQQNLFPIPLRALDLVV